MILKHSGIIVNITSDASISVYENWGIYGVSKAALDHLTAIWSKELPDITFLAIDPGDMYTKMHLNANPNANKESLHNPYNVAKDLSIFLSKGDYNFKKTRFSAYEWRERLL
jgi:NAD(P)-dependent dehydrogenase (short-subunit alcohol dehydrogenase family)